MGKISMMMVVLLMGSSNAALAAIEAGESETADVAEGSAQDNPEYSLAADQLCERQPVIAVTSHLIIRPAKCTKSGEVFRDYLTCLLYCR